MGGTRDVSARDSNVFFKFNSQTHMTYFDRLKNIIVSSSSKIMRAFSWLQNLNSNKG